MTEIELKSILIALKKNDDISSDKQAAAIIDEALANLDKKMDLAKVIFKLNQAINQYSIAHGLKLPSSLTKLKMMLDENPDKWQDAGLTWM